MKAFSTLIVGVGGQGTILAGKILGDFAKSKGFDMKVFEVHGMAQRGGGVVSHIRWGEKVYSPVIDPGSADALIAFEPLECLRWIHGLKENGILVCATNKIAPLPVAMGTAKYPQDVLDKIRQKAPQGIFIDSLNEADSLGGARVINILLLGAFAKLAGLDIEAFEDAIKVNIKQNFIWE
jgi:indolepyruvate ferredoxin oxidoreductase beta subunit